MSKLTAVTRGETEVCRAKVADSFITRGVGLLGRKNLGLNEGLLIQPCTSVHTWFMRFTIDVIFLDAEGVVVKYLTMSPFRFAFGGKGAKSALELSKGAADQVGLHVGDRLIFAAEEA